MFWKKKAQRLEPSPTAPAPQKSDTDALKQSAEVLAAALRSYAEAARIAAASKPDPELKKALDTVAAAEELVTDSGLAYALGRCLPEHVEHWPAWSKRSDFHDYVGFDAQEIEASNSEKQGTYRAIIVATIDFSFKGTRYRVTVNNEGTSSAPGDRFRFGEIELVANGETVAKFGLIQNLSDEYSTWTFSDVRALTVGPWMQHVLDMAAQIEASDRRRREEFFNERALAAAREIKLG